MKLSLTTLAIGTLAVLALGISTSHAQTTPLYTQLTAGTTAEPGVTDYLQEVTLAQGPGTYSINSFELGVNFTTGTEDDYGVILQFFTGLDNSPTSTDALANATYAGGVEGDLADPGQAGNFTYTFTLNTAITVPSNVVGVNILLTTSDFSSLSDDMNGRFIASAPTVGSAPGFVWNNPNDDGTFPGADQTTFGLGAAYTRLELIGTAPAPEPGSLALCGLGLGAGGFYLRRRRQARA